MKKAIVLAIASAGLVALSMPGSNFWPLAFFGLLPWAWASLCVERRAWLVDAAFAAAFISFTFWWIGYVSWIGAVFGILMEAALMLPLGWLLRRLSRGLPATVALPIAWCVVEFLRTRYPYGGVPYSLLGYAVWEQEALIQPAALGGVHAVSFLLALCNGFLLDVVVGLRGIRPVRWKVVVPALVLPWALGLIFSFPKESGAEPGPFVIAIQANIPAEAKGETLGPREIFDRHLSLSRQALQAHPEATLLVWPESMFPYALEDGGSPGEIIQPGSPPFTVDDARESEGYLRKAIFQKLFAHREISFLTGAIVYEKRGSSFVARNSALMLRPPDGERYSLYHKIHLVPGGEFVPNLGPISWIVEWFSELEGFRGQLGILEPGDRVKTMAFYYKPIGTMGTPYGRNPFTVSICYDNAYADLYREATLEQGAQFHTVLSNEGWYGNSSEMDQLLAASVFRAVETRKPFLRATNSGISALISPRGTVLQKVSDETGQTKHVTGILAARIPAAEAHPPYIRFGDIPWWSLCFVAAVFAIWPRKSGKLPAG